LHFDQHCSHRPVAGPTGPLIHLGNGLGLEERGAAESGGSVWRRRCRRRCEGADPGVTREGGRARHGARFSARCAREIPRRERQAMIERGAAVTVKRQAGAAGAQPLERVLLGAAGVGAGSAVDAADRRAASGGDQLSEELLTLLNRTVANTTAATVRLRDGRLDHGDVLSWCTNRCATFCAPSTGIQWKTSGHKRPKAERRTTQLVVTARLSSRRRTS